MEIQFGRNGLAPAICQDAETGEVLVQAWMNAEALALTSETGQVHFWSRSREEIWRKGATSGHYLDVDEILVDCDADSLLLKVRPHGPACHTGATSCFYRLLDGTGQAERVTLDSLARIIADRKSASPEESYTARLLAEGKEKRLQKVGEEAVEVIVAAGGQGRERTVEEMADLLYHLLVMLAGEDIPLADVYAELARRHR